MNVKYIKRDAEMDRIADAFSGYIHRHSNLDLVWSEKIGYVLMTINPDKRLGEEYCSFHTTHSLAYRLFSEIVTDVVLETESWNDSSNLDEMETKEVRLRWTPFWRCCRSMRLSAKIFSQGTRTNIANEVVYYGKRLWLFW